MKKLLLLILLASLSAQAADVPISGLPIVTSLNLTNIIPAIANTSPTGTVAIALSDLKTSLGITTDTTYASGTEIDVVSSAAETTIFTYPVPGTALGTDGMVRVSLIGDYLNNSGANRTFTLKVKYGATTLYGDSSGNITTSAGRRAWIFNFVLGNAASTSAQRMGGMFRMSSSTAPSVAGLGSINSGDITGALGTPYGTSAVDSTASQNVVVTIQHNASDAALSFRLTHSALSFQ